MSKLNRWLRACGIFLLWATAAVALPAQKFTSLHSFDYTDGANPEAGLVQARNGKFYGTTFGNGLNGWGTVFNMTTNGTLTVLYNFTGGADGGFSRAGLIQATDGDFYGTTQGGGGTGCVEGGCGAVFKITENGTLTPLYSFTGGADGAWPYAGLIQSGGYFYGTTQGGDGTYGYGTVFKITPTGTLTTIYSFCSQRGCPDGEGPYAGLVQGTDRKFYGTTSAGGAYGYGTVFKITPTGTLTTLHSFRVADGCSPDAGLVQGTDGNFYGTTNCGGANGWGTVFKISPSGTLTILHSFEITDGANPLAGLVQGTDGNFYGTTEVGGTNVYYGTVFEITSTPPYTLTTLHSFDMTDGEEPRGALAQAANGKFYGTTTSGGANTCGSETCGTAFSVSVGLGPSL